MIGDFKMIGIIIGIIGSLAFMGLSIFGFGFVNSEVLPHLQPIGYLLVIIGLLLSVIIFGLGEIIYMQYKKKKVEE
jgi:hypothetical protein